MQRILTCWLAIILLSVQPLNAQKKYALVVGINDYYDAPGRLYMHSLKGCVNDALSIKELLVNRFGFENSNISLLTNAEATKRNLLAKISQILRMIKPGDAFVFYYSGHGVWMSNDHNRSDKVKKGMSQAIVMSDLYSPNYNCLVRDETLKSIMNKFLDKKVTATTIMDCCYSANLMMLSRFDLFWSADEDRAKPKDFDFDDLPYYPELIPPVPCKWDSTDYVDSDSDGVINCRDWQVHSPSTYVDEKGVSVQFDPEDIYLAPDELADSLGVVENADTKAFDISQTLKDTVISLQMRPVDRKGGGFVSLAATSEYEKGLEIVDLSGSRHGAFTVALINYYNEHPASVPLGNVLRGIDSIMDKQLYKQGPSYYLEGDRGSKNLVGLEDGNEKPRLELSCIGTKSGQYILNKGRHAGIYPGNLFRVKGRAVRSILQIIQVSADSSVGKVISGNIVKGDRLEMISGFIQTAPRLKVFIPSVPFTQAGYEQFFRNKIIPLASKENLIGPEDSGKVPIKELRFYLGAQMLTSIKPYQQGESNNFMVYLPFPSYVAEGLKKALAKDQNIQLLSDSAGADMMLFMALQPGTKTEKPMIYIGFNTPEIMRNDYERNLFQPIFLKRDNLSFKTGGLPVFYKDMQVLLWRYLRKKTTAWLNDWPKASF